MKKINKVLVVLLILLVSPMIVKAADNLTIDSKSYDDETYEFKVSGISSYSEVMVSLFDGDDLLSFKTVSTSNNKYNATFDITFEQDKTVTIKVGDINSQDYKISTLDVKKSVVHINNTLVDQDGNQFIIKGANSSFGDRERLILNIYSMDDIDALLDEVKGTDAEEEFTQAYNIIKLALGNKELLSYIEVFVEDDMGHRLDYASHMGGFTLKINLDKETYDSLGNFEIAQLNDETGLLGDPIEYSYDEEAEMFIVNMDRPGILLSYKKVDEVKEEVKEESTNNPKTSDTIKVSFILLALSVVGIMGTTIYFKKQK